jgi:D-hexose-6-phosphate mutarotase
VVSGALLYSLAMSNTATEYHKMSNVEIVKALKGREVFYLADKSKTTATLHRYFKILDVENVAIAAKTGLRYVTAKVIDHDNGDVETHKNLRLQDLDVLA